MAGGLAAGGGGNKIKGGNWTVARFFSVSVSCSLPENALQTMKDMDPKYLVTHTMVLQYLCHVCRLSMFQCENMRAIVQKG